MCCRVLQPAYMLYLSVYSPRYDIGMTKALNTLDHYASCVKALFYMAHHLQDWRDEHPVGARYWEDNFRDLRMRLMELDKRLLNQSRLGQVYSITELDAVYSGYLELARQHMSSLELSQYMEYAELHFQAYHTSMGALL